MQKAEEFHEYRKWANELPALHFDKEWDVKIIPPFAGAIIRFCINHNGKYVSVYFDGYSELGGCVMRMTNQYLILSIMTATRLTDIC